MASPQNETQSSLVSQPDAGPFTAELRSIYIDFLDKMGYDNSPDVCTPDTYFQVHAALTDLCGSSYIDPGVLKLSSGFPAMVCRYHTLEEQVKFGHYAVLTIMIDDMSQSLNGEAKEKFLEDLAVFQLKMCDPQGYAAAYPGRGDLHPVLEDFTHYLQTEQNPFFPAHPRTLSMVVKSSLDFLEANLLEQHYQEHPMNYTPDMRLFCNFLRYKSGVAEAYASFVILNIGCSSTSLRMDDNFYHNHIYPLMPELVEAINLINDVLSFYKEVHDGDAAITILINAKVKKLSPLDAVRDITDYLVEQRIRVMAIVEASGSLEWKKKIEQFYQGYIGWHLGVFRYRFKELLGDWYQGEGEYWK